MTAVEIVSAEERIAERLRLPNLFAGALSTDERRGRVRAVCIELAPCIAGRGPDGKCERYAEMFERLYGEPLIPKKSKERSR